MKNITFADFYGYCARATRDEFGFHQISHNWILHIYSGCTQVNVIKKIGNNNVTVGNLVFVKDELGRVKYVRPIRVIDEIAQYDTSTSILQINKEIERIGNNDWFRWFGPEHALSVREVMRDILMPMKEVVRF